MTRGENQPAHESASAVRDVTLAEKVAFLSLPASHPDAPERVEVVETHMSWVFLTRDFAHKLKKPVHYEFLDFRKLEDRRHYCEEEIRLNRRLAHRVYIAAVPLTVDAEGDLALDGPGEPVDWLVRMHRLPDARMLDRAIISQDIPAGDLEGVARLLADFYRGAIRVAVPPSDFRGRLADAIIRYRQELTAPEFHLPTVLIDPLYRALGGMIANNGALFEARIRAGCVVEGHGDLRPEHVFLGPEPAVIDCLEFNRDFRILDRADELAYLALECERLGAPDAGSAILNSCCRALGDAPPPELIHFYKTYRAMLRATLAIQHLRDEEVREPEKWRPRALEYLALAESYAGQLS